MGKHECFKCDFVTFIYTYNIKKISKNFIKYFIRIPNTTKKYYAFFLPTTGCCVTTHCPVQQLLNFTNKYPC